MPGLPISATPQRCKSLIWTLLHNTRAPNEIYLLSRSRHSSLEGYLFGAKIYLTELKIKECSSQNAKDARESKATKKVQR